MSVSIPPLLLHELSSPSSRVHDQAARSATEGDGPAAAGRTMKGEAVAVTDGDRLRLFLDRRGMEIGFAVDPQTGSSRMIVVDTSTGRTVLEIPAGSPLESAAKEVLRGSSTQG